MTGDRSYLAAGAALLALVALPLAACSGAVQPFATPTEEKTALAPPIDPEKRAGPNAEKEIDYETLYGPGATSTDPAPVAEPPLRTATSPPAAESQPPGPDKPVIRAVAVASVTGAPGSGNQELAVALKRVLTDAGWPVVSSGGEDTLAIEGRIALTEPKDSTQKVTLSWTLKAPGGRVLGTVDQANDVPAGSLDEAWGETADHAAQAAAAGIFDLVDKLR